MSKPQLKRSFTVLLLCQGIYYFITGLWPLVHMLSFMAVSGYKVDQWLVKMVGALILPVSIILLRAFVVKSVTWETFIIAVGSAIAFLAIDVYYAGIGRISPVYLVDAASQVVFIVWWLVMIKHISTQQT